MICDNCSVPLLILCTRYLLHVAPTMCGHLVYCELLLLSQVGLRVCSWNQILWICEYRLICGEGVMHVNTGIVLVWKIVPDFCLPHFMIVVSPGALPAFQSSCFCLPWLSFLHSSGFTFLVCLVWWCIHRHIKLLMILMGLSEFWGKCGSASLVFLDLLCRVLIYVWTQLCLHLVVLMSYNFP